MAHDILHQQQLLQEDQCKDYAAIVMVKTSPDFLARTCLPGPCGHDQLTSHAGILSHLASEVCAFNILARLAGSQATFLLTMNA